jgi:hypothetical protein
VGRERLTPGRPTDAIAEGCVSRTATKSEVRVHVLYKGVEILAKMAFPAFAISVTYRRQEMAENSGSIPVSVTNYFKINHLQTRCTGVAVQASAKDTARAGIRMNRAEFVREPHKRLRETHAHFVVRCLNLAHERADCWGDLEDVALEHMIQNPNSLRGGNGV